MNKKTTCLVVLFYGILLVGLGLLGYMKAGSIISLMIGIVFGGLSVISSLLLFAKNVIGLYAATAISALLTILFAVRFFVTQKTLTGGMTVVSAIVLIYLLVQLTERKRK